MSLRNVFNFGQRSFTSERKPNICSSLDWICGVTWRQRWATGATLQLSKLWGLTFDLRSHSSSSLSWSSLYFLLSSDSTSCIPASLGHWLLQTVLHSWLNHGFAPPDCGSEVQNWTWFLEDVGPSRLRSFFILVWTRETAGREVKHLEETKSKWVQDLDWGSTHSLVFLVCREDWIFSSFSHTFHRESFLSLMNPRVWFWCGCRSVSAAPAWGSIWASALGPGSDDTSSVSGPPPPSSHSWQSSDQCSSCGSGRVGVRVRLLSVSNHMRNKSKHKEDGTMLKWASPWATWRHSGSGSCPDGTPPLCR